MTRDTLRRIAALEATLDDVEEVPWHEYTATFNPLDGETWDEMRDRARHWLNGEAVPGQYGIRSPRCCEALLFAYPDGEILSERISVENPAYRRQPPTARANRILDARLEEFLSAN